MMPYLRFKKSLALKNSLTSLKKKSFLFHSFPLSLLFFIQSGSRWHNYFTIKLCKIFYRTILMLKGNNYCL